MKFAEPTKLHRKSGFWGARPWLHRYSLAAQAKVTAHGELRDTVRQQALDPHGSALGYGSDGVAQSRIAFVYDPIQQASDVFGAGTALLIVCRTRQGRTERSIVGIRTA